MFFDPKTKRYIGKMRNLTSKELAKIEQDIADGKAHSTAPPSKEDLEFACQIRERLGLRKELDELMDNVTDEEREKFRFPTDLPNYGDKI